MQTIDYKGQSQWVSVLTGALCKGNFFSKVQRKPQSFLCKIGPAINLTPKAIKPLMIDLLIFTAIQVTTPRAFSPDLDAIFPSLKGQFDINDKLLQLHHPTKVIIKSYHKFFFQM